MPTEMPNPPIATYRVQLQSEFTLDHCTEAADYWAELGISHVYTSPCLQASPGSTSGYDVVDYACVSSELGGESAFTAFSECLHTHRLGHVLDIVPNHMGIEGQNLWWEDVLRNGQASLYAHCFDVHWRAPQPGLRNKVLLPILGDHYARILESGKFRLDQQGGRFLVHYETNVLPVAPESLRGMLAIAAQRSGSQQLAFIADVLAFLLAPASDERDERVRRHRVQEVIEELLARLCRETPPVAQAIQQVVAEVNRDPDALDALLEAQNYRLAFWRSADSDLNYRRFFNINKLIGMRTEDEEVFNLTHALVLRWLREGRLNGLRVDHIDGLREPAAYLQHLRQQAGPAYIVVEKILEPGERLPAWPVAGTTGYDFLNRVNGLFVDPAGEAPLTEFYAHVTGQPTEFRRIVHECKELVLEGFGGDLERLTGLLVPLCHSRRQYRDYARQEIRQVLAEVLVSYPVYRTYVRAPEGQFTPDDERFVRQAVEGGRTARPDLDAALFDFVADLMLGKHTGRAESDFVMRLQQLTGAVEAKGVEDTAFYRFNRLVTLNEVGGDPAQFGLSLDDFHRAMEDAHRYWPASMLATSTHDTKRSEDVRARINLISEMPHAWAEAVRRWMGMHERRRQGDWPDRNAEYLFYQTLVGAWPLPVDRALAYMHKASHEAKQYTSWSDPNPDYDQALKSFVESALNDAAFLSDMEAFVRPLITPGRVNSLAQTLLKLTAPGVPDIYQGTELWDLSLVDPDNRRSVDYARRRRLLEGLRHSSLEDVSRGWEDGLPKLWLIRQTLALRQRRPELFGAQAAYRRLPAAGARAGHVVAFLRRDEVATVTPRLVIGLNGDWRDTALELPPGAWRNALTGELVASDGHAPLASLLGAFPVALLERQQKGS